MVTLGLREKPPDWLNEMIPWQGKYYSAFPLGAVLSMFPVALLRDTGLIQSFPGRVLAALIAGLSVYFFFGLAKAFGNDYSGLKGPAAARLARRIMLALFPIFGTWTWCNLGFGGAWQIALGLAVLGQAAALYYTLVRPSPFVAGAFFSLAFGNRTELLITMPLYLYFLWRQPNGKLKGTVVASGTVVDFSEGSSPPQAANAIGRTKLRQALQEKAPMLIRFLSLPVTLGLRLPPTTLRVSIPFSTLVTSTSRKCATSLGISTAYSQYMLFRGISIPCYSKALRVLITFLTFGQTALAARSFWPPRSYAFCFAKADDIK